MSSNLETSYSACKDKNTHSLFHGEAARVQNPEPRGEKENYLEKFPGEMLEKNETQRQNLLTSWWNIKFAGEMLVKFLQDFSMKFRS